MKRLFALALTLASAPAWSAVPVTGKWVTTEKDSVVAIAPCGAHLCGRIERILKPKPGGPVVDANNPNPALRSRPILGMAILTGFADAGKKWTGTIYDPRAGKSYRSEIVKLANGHLQVKGCVGMFCRTMVWTPAG